jgi:hypothetical protein
VDICRKHGIWFDSGELPHVLAFVEAGGLEIERQRELDKARDDARRERVIATEKKLAPLGAPARHWSVANARASVELGHAGAALLDFVRELLSSR